jgi:hypothetical protein
MDDHHAAAASTQTIEIRRGRGPVWLFLGSCVMAGLGCWLLLTPDAIGGGGADNLGPSRAARSADVLDATARRWPWVLVAVLVLFVAGTTVAAVLCLWRFVHRRDVAVLIDARGTYLNVLPWQSRRVEWTEVSGVRLSGGGRQAVVEIDRRSGRTVRVPTQWIDGDPEVLRDHLDAAWRAATGADDQAPGRTSVMRGGSGRAS